MALKTYAAFAAGVVAGWTGRAVFGSTRELMVQGLVVAHQLEGRAKRLVAERLEWAVDMLAEGRARHEHETEQGTADSSPQIERAVDDGGVVAAGRRGRAA
jgi:hypothetical protein